MKIGRVGMTHPSRKMKKGKREGIQWECERYKYVVVNNKKNKEEMRVFDMTRGKKERKEGRRNQSV